eukprot:2346534-Amphidinium_carterae.2
MALCPGHHDHPSQVPPPAFVRKNSHTLTKTWATCSLFSGDHFQYCHTKTRPHTHAYTKM